MGKHLKGIRFFVGTDNRKRSNVWKIAISKNDIYIMSRSFGRDYKISLHESGKCRCALTSEFAERKGIKNCQRLFDEWTIDTGQQQPQIAYTINFLNDQLLDFSSIQGLPISAIHIPPASEGHYTKVIVYRLGIVAGTLDCLIPNGLSVIYADRTSDNKGLVVMYCYPALGEDIITQEAERIKSFQKTKEDLIKADRLKTDGKIACFFGTRMQNGERGITELYV